MNKFCKKIQHTYFASCPVGFEEELKTELKEFGIERAKIQRGGVEFQDNENRYLDVLVNSRLSSRLFLKLFEASMRKEKDLYEISKSISWDEHMRVDQTFKIKTLFSGAGGRVPFSNPLILNQIFKDGIADYFREKMGKRPSIETEYPDLTYLLHLSADFKPGVYNVDILVDLCGAPLSNRGYRDAQFIAPLRENLAAGIVRLMNIKFDHETFIDSMCGSGTVLIEAAMMANNISPSYFKIKNAKFAVWAIENYFPFISDGEGQKKFKEIKEKASQYTLNKNIEFFGFDNSSRSLEDCHHHLGLMGLDRVVKIKKADAATIKPIHSPHVIFCNPPYAKRMGEEEELETLYYEYGENLKHQFKGDRAYVFTGNANLAKKISLRTSKRIILFNGSIESRLLEYKLF